MNVARILEQVGAAPGDFHAVTPAGARTLSVTDFMTDGSLAALCEELSTLTGIKLEVRDARGRRIERNEDGGKPWRIADGSEHELSDKEAALAVPLLVGGVRIGSLRAVPEAAGDGPGTRADRAVLERVVKLLAQTAAELCEHELELRDRIKEASALYRMSGLLVRAAGVEQVMQTALDSALHALGMDAGSVVLFKEDMEGEIADDESDLTLKAHRGLSKEYLDHPQPLSRNREFDRIALSGHVVMVEDLMEDPRVQLKHMIAREGMRSFLNAGMVFHGRPIGVIRLYSRDRREFGDPERRLLKSIAHQATVAVEQARLLKFEQEEQRVQRQLQLAGDVQRRMLPRQVPQIPGLDIAATYVPSFELGGDFYDFIDLNGHFGLVVGDVVGKGVAAALLMSAVRASLRAHVQEVYHLDEVVSRVNKAMCRDTRDNEFASLWYGVIDPLTLGLTYCSAGHEPTMVVRPPRNRAPSKQNITELDVGGMVVGLDPNQKYERQVFELRPRDVLVAMTDGVTDVVNFEHKKFTRERLRETLLKILKNEPEATAARIVELIQWEIRQFAGLMPRPDDFTLVVVRVNEKK
jgi:sigma-B regulation protein RsbU (phosphoserine phosphatase)